MDTRHRQLSLFALALFACAAMSISPAAANFPPAQIRLDSQIAKSTLWGAIRVTHLRFEGDPAEATWVDFELLGAQGNLLSNGTLWHEGAYVEGGIWTSRMPEFEVGKYYVVILHTRNERLELVNHARSVLPIENLTEGSLSAWDAVRLTRWHAFVPPGGSSSVEDVQLFELLDGLASLERTAKGGTP